MFTDLTIKAIDFNLSVYNQTASAVKAASVKELHGVQDKYVETINTLTENAKKFLETTSIEKFYTGSKSN